MDISEYIAPGYFGLPRVAWMRTSEVRYQFFSAPQVATKEAVLAKDSRLKPIIGKGMLCGSMATSVAPYNLAVWWFRRANFAGVQQADADLDAWLTATHTMQLDTVWFYGVRIETKIEIAENIFLAPPEILRFSPPAQEALQLTLDHGQPFRPIPSVVLIQEGIRQKLYDWNTHSPPFRDRSLLNAVPLLIGLIPGCFAVNAFQSGDVYEDTPGEGGSGGGYDLMHGWTPRSVRTLDPEDVALLREVIAAYKRITQSKDREILTRALRRLARAKLRGDRHDAALDLGICLEMLLIGGTAKTEISHQFSMRGARLAADSLPDRLEALKLLKAIYSDRSLVAHGGHSKHLASVSADERLDVHENLVIKIIRKWMLNPTADWDAEFLGVH